MSFEIAAMQAVYAALDGVVSCDVYNIAPQKTKPPYISLGAFISNENGTSTEVSRQISFTINVWSDSTSDLEALTIQGEVENALDLVKFSATGYSFTENYFINSQVFDDPDGVTRHGVQEFQLYIERV